MLTDQDKKDEAKAVYEEALSVNNDDRMKQILESNMKALNGQETANVIPAAKIVAP